MDLLSCLRNLMMLLELLVGLYGNVIWEDLTQLGEELNGRGHHYHPSTEQLIFIMEWLFLFARVRSLTLIGC